MLVMYLLSFVHMKYDVYKQQHEYDGRQLDKDVSSLEL